MTNAHRSEVRLNNEWVKNEIREEIKKFLGTTKKWTHNNPKLLGHSKGSPEREVRGDTGLPKKDRNISNKQPNSMPLCGLLANHTQ